MMGRRITTSRLVFSCWMLVCLACSTCLADDADSPLKVVTYNIRFANPGDGDDVWDNRSETVADFIAENDVIGLQEVTYAQLRDLRDRLDGFDWYGVGRDDGKHGGEHAVIFYRRQRLELIDKGTIWLSHSPDRAGSKGWDAALPRTCTWMTLRDRASGNRWWFANTHFDHRGGRARVESGKLIHQFVADEAADLPIVVLGDFNCLPDSEPYRELIRDDLLVDARAASKSEPVGPKTTWNGFRELAADRIIDHVFVGGPVEVLSLETLNPKTPSDRFASDHLPVRVTLRTATSESAGAARGR